jgi:hypothetical protein
VRKTAGFLSIVSTDCPLGTVRAAGNGLAKQNVTHSPNLWEIFRCATHFLQPAGATCIPGKVLSFPSSLSNFGLRKVNANESRGGMIAAKIASGCESNISLFYLGFWIDQSWRSPRGVKKRTRLTGPFRTIVANEIPGNGQDAMRAEIETTEWSSSGIQEVILVGI